MRRPQSQRKLLHNSSCDQGPGSVLVNSHSIYRRDEGSSGVFSPNRTLGGVTFKGGSGRRGAEDAEVGSVGMGFGVPAGQ